MKHLKVFVCAALFMFCMGIFATNVYAAPTDGLWTDSYGYTHYYVNGQEMRNYHDWIDGGWRYFDSWGDMVTGWYEVDEGWGPDWHYFGEDGLAYTGRQVVDGVEYCFSYCGELYDDYGDFIENDDSYVFQVNNYGEVVSKVQLIKGDWTYAFDEWYYFDAYGDPVNGCYTVKGVEYYFSSGHLQDGFGEFFEYDGTYVIKVNNSGKVVGKVTCKPNQWTSAFGEKFWFNEDGPEYGLKVIDGKTYFLEYPGMMTRSQLVWCDEDGNYRYFDSNGNMVQSQWIQINDENGKYWYYFGEDGIAYTGIRTVGQKEYFFWGDGTLYETTYEEVFYDDTYLCLIKPNGEVSYKIKYKVQQWNQIGDKWYFFDSVGEGANGLRVINGKEYYFSNGEMQTDFLTYEFDEVCAFDKTGARVKDAWYLSKGSSELRWYYFDASGAPAQGWIKYGSYWYYFEDGMAYVGDYVMEYNGKDFYYHFASDGKMTQQIEMQNGWILNGEIWYYWDGYDFARNEWKYINGQEYYFDEDGWMCTSAVIDGYVLGANGKIVKNGWVRLDHYYFYNNYRDNVKTYAWANQYGRAVTGWQKINNVWYWFNSAGAMATDSVEIYNYKNGTWEVHDFATNGRWLGQSIVRNGWEFIDGNYYYYQNGYPITGWKEVNRKWYYLSEDTGEMLSSTISYIDDELYVFSASGALANGWVPNDYGTWYLADGKGVAKIGWQKVGAKWYYLDYDTYTGLQYIYEDNEWHLFAQNGTWIGQVNPVEGWNKFDGKWYYLEDGMLVWYWIEDGGKYYYLDYDGMCTTWIYAEPWGYGYLEGKQYCYGFNANGSLARNQWIYTKEFGYVYCDGLGMFVAPNSIWKNYHYS